MSLDKLGITVRIVPEGNISREEIIARLEKAVGEGAFIERYADDRFPVDEEAVLADDGPRKMIEELRIRKGVEAIGIKTGPPDDSSEEFVSVVKTPIRKGDGILLDDELDELLPFRGPCGICGGPDARHRLLDSLRGSYRAGEKIPAIAKEFAVPERAVELAILLDEETAAIYSLERRTRAISEPLKGKALEVIPEIAGRAAAAMELGIRVRAIASSRLEAIELLEDAWTQFATGDKDERGYPLSLWSGGLSTLDEIEDYLRELDRLDEKGIPRRWNRESAENGLRSSTETASEGGGDNSGTSPSDSSSTE